MIIIGDAHQSGQESLHAQRAQGKDKYERREGGDCPSQGAGLDRQVASICSSFQFLSIQN